MTFILMMLILWAVCGAGWFVVSKSFRTADIDKIKSRLTGAGSKQKKLKNDGGPTSLINQDGDTGTRQNILILVQNGHETRA